MNTKLIKHEFRATSRIFLPLLGAAAGLSALSWIFMQLGSARLAASMGAFFHKAFSITANLLSVCTFLTLLALMVCCVVVTIQRFYKNILGDEGYLMLTLPATPAQHIAAKLLTGTVWTVAALLVAVCAAIALGTAAVEVTVTDGTGVTTQHLTLAQAAASFEATYAIELWRVAGILFLLFLAGVVNTYLLAYLCMAVGSRWPQQRLGASIGVFVAADFIRRIVWIALIFLFGLLCDKLAPWIFAGRFAVQFLTITAFLLGILCLEAIAYFFATRHILTNRLNLA